MPSQLATDTAEQMVTSINTHLAGSYRAVLAPAHPDEDNRAEVLIGTRVLEPEERWELVGKIVVSDDPERADAVHVTVLLDTEHRDALKDLL